MAILRIFIVSLLAAVLACALASRVLYGPIERASFILLPFILMGSLFLLAPAYGAAKEADLALRIRYVRLLLFGAIAGALLLGTIGIRTGPAQGALIGAFYGATTAVFWMLLHFVTKRFNRRVQNLKYR